MNIRFFYLATIAILISSCSTIKNSYQLISTKPIEDSKMTNFTEESLIEFDFWGLNGNAGFKIINISEENIIINLDSCFFITNGEVHDLFLSREFSSSRSTSRSYISSATVIDQINSTTQSFYNLSGNAVGAVTNGMSTENINESGITWHETPHLIIPPNTHRIIEEYSIVSTPFTYCNLQQNPYKRLKKGNEISKSFTLVDSPLLFSIVINYSRGNGSITNKYDFYVSEIQNKKSDEIFRMVTEDDCGNSVWENSYYEFISSEKTEFFVRYKVVD